MFIAGAGKGKEHTIPMHYLLFYEVGEDYVSRRAEFREEHLEKAWRASEQGELILGGALADPVDGAVLLFEGDSPEVAEKFATADPYVMSGAVKRWHVREWTTVVGEDAAKPVMPVAKGRGTANAIESSNPSRAGDAPCKSGILRMWKARSTVEKVGRYVQHATKKVFQSYAPLKDIAELICCAAPWMARLSLSSLPFGTQCRRCAGSQG